MTRDEFSGAAAILDGGWPGEFTEADENAYYFLLSDFEIDDVMRALRALRGSKFRPAASEIVAALSPQLAAVPTFDEMFALLFGASGVLHARAPAGVYEDGAARMLAQEQAVRVRLAGVHPMVASFVDRQGLQRLRLLEVFDADQGHWRRKELREAWAEHVEAMEGREIAALSAGRGRGDLGRLDPLTALGRPGRGELPAGA